MLQQQQQKKNKKSDTENNNNNKKDERKKEETPMTVILKVDTHCDTCRSKIARCLRGSHASSSSNMNMKLNVVVVEGECGKVDPTKLTEKLSNKMKNKVDLVSPHPNKNHSKPEDNKSKQPPVVNTVVLKVAMHCQGCIERIRKTVLKTKGVQDMAIDKEKETVTVKGTMEVKALVGNLMERLKKKVEVVPPKKEKEENGDKKGATDKGGNGDSKKKKGGGGGGGGGGDNVKDDKGSGGDGQGKGKIEQNKMEPLVKVHDPVYGYGYGYYGYGGDYNYEPVYMGQLHAPQFFSDENPNACSIM
ncbi:hypothetical protein Lal_00002897 [Lupinus albus]|uniref:Putative heavy metal-associated domain, HMA n=1 Tax=Lupinus albus TaxID=3870 RepID=A0A6A5N9C6_LUPAL|nr:putative heavy metal-associated domain, HMA [Lupinus albus]KAF1882717.1 hypothetical protein Lal_00002897 [Lupinus albus]